MRHKFELKIVVFSYFALLREISGGHISIASLENAIFPIDDWRALVFKGVENSDLLKSVDYHPVTARLRWAGLEGMFKHAEKDKRVLWMPRSMGVHSSTLVRPFLERFDLNGLTMGSIYRAVDVARQIKTQKPDLLVVS